MFGTHVGDIGFQKAVLTKTNESDVILLFPESRPSFFFFFFFLQRHLKQHGVHEHGKQKLLSAGIWFSVP